MRVFLDTDVVINILKKRSDTIETLRQLIEKRAKFFISPIVIAEVYQGARKKEFEEIEQLFSYFEVIDIDAQIGYKAGMYANRYAKAYYTISLEDYLIAATVHIYDLVLWTYNIKHYPMDDIELLKGV